MLFLAPIPVLPGPPPDPKDLTFAALSAGLQIDGKIEAGEWPDAARREGFADADTGLASDEHAEFWLTADGTFIYLAGRVRTDPGRLVDDEYRPNVSLRNNDHMRLSIDPFGTAQSFNTFSVNPQGATSIELAGGRAAKTEWVGEFEAFGRKSETGWEFECRIPWEVMDLPAAGIRDVRFNVAWYRSNRANTYSYKYVAGASANSPFWRSVPIPAVHRARTLKLLPYMIGGFGEDGHIVEAGLDFKGELAPGIAAVGTVNPDFRNVESGILSIDPSFFERLASDNRPFFAEGSRYRNVGYDAKIFAPQRIRAIDAGLNFYGRLGERTSAALLATADFGERQALVASFGHSFDDRRTLDFAYAGNYEPGRRNHALNLSYNHRFGEWLSYYSAQLTDDQERSSGHRVNFGAFREAAGVEEGFELIEVSPGFFPRIGFAAETDLRGANVWHTREFQYQRGPLSELQYEASALYYDRTGGGSYRRSVRAELSTRTRAGLEVGLGASYSRFERFDDVGWGIGASYPAGSPYRNVYANYTNDSFREDNVQSYEFGFQYRPIRRLQISVSNEFVSAAQGDEVQQVASWNWDIGRFESLGGRLVRREDDVNWYLSYRMSGKRGAEWFLIVGDPNSREFEPRILIKVVVPISVRL